MNTSSANAHSVRARLRSSCAASTPRYREDRRAGLTNPRATSAPRTRIRGYESDNGSFARLKTATLAIRSPRCLPLGSDKASIATGGSTHFTV